MGGMTHDLARDMVCLIEEHIPDPDRFEICLCTRDGGVSFGVYIDDLKSHTGAIVEDEDEAGQLVLLLQAVNVMDPPT